jgi:pseudoazurin
MKNTLFLSLFFLTTLVFAGKKYEDQVIERITCPTQKCEEGQTLDIEIPSMMEETSEDAVEKVKLSEGSEHIVKMLNSGDGGQMIFEPAVIKVSVGDTVHFKAIDAAHNSVSVDGMVPSGAVSWASQLSQDISVTLDTEGVYVYQCDPHLIMAMVGVIQVGDAVNIDDIRNSASSYSANFLMNNDRLQSYLNQL